MVKLPYINAIDNFSYSPVIWPHLRIFFDILYAAEGQSETINLHID